MRRDAYSVSVQWLRIGLPLVGLFLLGSVFFVADRPDSEAALPFADAALVERMRQRQVTAPYFAGVTASNDPIHVEANMVQAPIDQDVLIGNAISLQISSQDEAALVELTATRGRIATNDGLVSLDRGVLIDVEGWHIIATDMMAALDQTRIWTELPLTARGPLGELKAGSMELRRIEETAPLVLHFKDGVQIVYAHPQTR